MGLNGLIWDHNRADCNSSMPFSVGVLGEQFQITTRLWLGHRPLLADDTTIRGPGATVFSHRFFSNYQEKTSTLFDVWGP